MPRRNISELKQAAGMGDARRKCDYTTINFGCPVDIVENAIKYCVAANITMSEFIRQAIQAKLKEID